MVLRYSNSEYLTVLDPIPLDNIGWYARVLSERDYSSQVALIHRFAGLGFTKEESGVGGGRVVLDAQDRLFTDPLPAGETARVQDQEALIQIIEDGIVRFEFLAEDLLEDQLTETGKLTTEITGRGTGAVLAWAPVLPAGMPNPTTMERTFNAAPLAVWHTLFLEAQADGYLTWVDCLFDGGVDSAGIAWSGAQDVTVQAGGHLLDLLTQFCEAEGYVWRMNPGFRLTVMKDPGQNREGEVVFTMYRDQALQQRLVTRREIGNVVYASSGDGIAVAGDMTSAGRWRKRAKWVQAGGTDASGRSAVANTVLNLSKTEKESRTLQIDPLRPGRRLFTDFDVSDWVGIEIPDGSSSAGSRKVVAISVDIDENAVVKPELTLQSRFEARAIKQQKMLDMLGGGSSTEAGASPIPVSAALSSARMTDMLDVDLTGAAAGDVLLWDGEKVIDADLNLNLLGDVDLGTPSDGQVLVFDAAAGQWKNGTPAAGGGGGGSSSGLLATVKYGSGTSTAMGSAVGLMAVAQFPELAFTLTGAGAVQIDAVFYMQTSSATDVCFAVSADNFATYSVADAYGTTPSGALVAWPAGWVIQQQKTRPAGDTQFQAVTAAPLLLNLPAGSYKVRIYKKTATLMSAAEHAGFATVRKL